ncbi:hypothetical protein A2V54_01545 [candidate division WWE3 bacterium RBG_19FT_COMBO_53_11]|uniref:Uncharacterized protein n=1 Tax=candidate division WWE3 bacterium RBG_19FT_COMBO_53_11 TaxID=1802613 RepID=A0A1F4UJ12_UNCKA|nr:MAG: hypothetical protein A2V54_01545 [candidate division WWE3 bacterium RBG_19FT_COMBO_53_11]
MAIRGRLSPRFPLFPAENMGWGRPGLFSPLRRFSEKLNKGLRMPKFRINPKSGGLDEWKPGKRRRLFG